MFKDDVDKQGSTIPRHQSSMESKVQEDHFNSL